MTRERRRAEEIAKNHSDGGCWKNADLPNLIDDIAAALLAERQRATRSALDGLARWARDPGWCLCSEGIAVGHHRKAVCVAAEIERRAREARARGRKRC